MSGLIVRLRDTEEYGDRICTRVFVGRDPDHLQLAGVLHLDVGEWQIIGAALLAGAQMFGPAHLIVESPDDQALVERRQVVAAAEAGAS
jgi:hypothetical protein